MQAVETRATRKAREEQQGIVDTVVQEDDRVVFVHRAPRQELYVPEPDVADVVGDLRITEAELDAGN